MNDVNEFLKVSIFSSLVVFLILGNAWALHWIFSLDLRYMQDIFISAFLSIFVTIVELTICRIVTGKLRIRIVWEEPCEQSDEVQ